MFFPVQAEDCIRFRKTDIAYLGKNKAIIFTENKFPKV